jgi:hypothetical protein
MNPDEQRIVERQAELTAWLSEVQMGMIILTSEVTLPEDKIRARFRVELGKILEQPA